jgi:thiamine-phosphate diphosphorylase
MNVGNEYPLYLISGEPCDTIKQFLQCLESSLNNHLIKLVQIRAASMDYENYRKLARKAVQLCHRYHAKAILNTHINLLEETQADGIHLPSRALMELKTRPVSQDYLFSAACHNEEEVIHASKINADFAVVSPIFPTQSSPTKKPLGWKNFSRLVKLSTIPVYALGNVTPSHLEIAKSHGAVGIAAIRSLWDANLSLTKEK